MRKIVLILLALLPTFSLFSQRDNQQVVKRPVADWGTISFEDLKNNPLWGTMQDMESLTILDPNNFDISVEVENDFLYEKPKLRIDGNKIILDIHPKGEWCECLFPTNLNINICSTQKPGAYDAEGKNYEKTIHPIHIKVVKNRAWLPRCFWVIISIIGLILLILYIRAMLRKRRFKKYATITPIYYDRYGQEVDDGAGQKLRKKGFTAWFARWFLPQDETCSLSFYKPKVDGIQFTASESSDVILLPKSSFNSDTMRVDGYNPDQDSHPEEPVKLGSSSKIHFYQTGSIEEGFLRFDAYEKRDGRGYKAFLSLLLAASILIVIGLLYLMIKSFM